MITLITGSPGSGKTLYCIDKIIQPILGTSVEGESEFGESEKYNRVVYTNINGLLLEHELIDAKWLESLHENKTPGAFVVFDEVQRVWPNRPSGSKKPPAVEYLETHRHDGIDVVLLTQNPQLLDPAVRALIGRHLHMRRIGGMGAAVVYEWDACNNGLNFKAAFTKKPYKYSRRVFGLYKSSRVHTKQNRSVPFAVWMLLIALLAAAVLWPRVINRIKQPQSVVPDVAMSSNDGEMRSMKMSDSMMQKITQATGGENHVMTADEYRDSLKPRIGNQPHTAPRYDDLTRPVVVPYPAACIEMGETCRCYTQQATRLNIDEMSCRQFVANGVFLDFVNPTSAPVQNRVLPVAASDRVEYMGPFDPAPSRNLTTPDQVAGEFRQSVGRAFPDVRGSVN